jgi:hypothetical protein
MYANQSVFVVCNGPSFQEVDWTLLKQPGIITFGMNNGGHLFRPNFWACADDPVRFMGSIWVDPTITKFLPMSHFEKPIWDLTNDRYSEKCPGDFPNVLGVRLNERFNADTWLDEDSVNWGNHFEVGGGRSILLVVLRISCLLGFKDIHLVGCDFHMSPTKKYWFDEDRSENIIYNNNRNYTAVEGLLAELAPKLKAAGHRVFNTNPQSKLEIFPYKDISEAVIENRINLCSTTRGMYSRSS